MDRFSDSDFIIVLETFRKLGIDPLRTNESSLFKKTCVVKILQDKLGDESSDFLSIFWDKYQVNIDRIMSDIKSNTHIEYLTPELYVLFKGLEPIDENIQHSLDENVKNSIDKSLKDKIHENLNDEIHENEDVEDENHENEQYQADLENEAISSETLLRQRIHWSNEELCSLLSLLVYFQFFEIPIYHVQRDLLNPFLVQLVCMLSTLAGTSFTRTVGAIIKYMYKLRKSTIICFTEEEFQEHGMNRNILIFKYLLSKYCIIGLKSINNPNSFNINEIPHHMIKSRNVQLFNIYISPLLIENLEKSNEANKTNLIYQQYLQKNIKSFQKSTSSSSSTHSNDFLKEIQLEMKKTIHFQMNYKNDISFSLNSFLDLIDAPLTSISLLYQLNLAINNDNNHHHHLIYANWDGKNSNSNSNDKLLQKDLKSLIINFSLFCHLIFVKCNNFSISAK